jgi:peptidoglycan-associated lipoprotein
MRISSTRSVIYFAMLALMLTAAGCRRQVATVAPPPPPAPAPAPAQPTVTLQVSPPIVQRGQSATLQWSSTNATTLSLAPGVGNVAPEGSTSTSPTDSTTYTITATGPGGSAQATARVTVTAAAPPVASTPEPTMDELFSREVADAYFDYDKADIRADARDALSKTAQFLRSYPQIKVVLGGHCDERGSTEYNIALGDRRAEAAKNFLVSLGVAADRMQTVSYGKERPFCTQQTEECWMQNRRAHFAPAR